MGKKMKGHSWQNIRWSLAAGKLPALLCKLHCNETMMVIVDENEDVDHDVDDIDDHKDDDRMLMIRMIIRIDHNDDD